MLLISRTILFLGFYIVVASTSPTAATQNSNHSALLVPRAKPVNNYCEPTFDWVRRECVASVQLTSWRDVCEGGLQIYSSCSAGTVCEDVLDEWDEVIRCVPLQPEGSTSPREKKSDPQVGTSDKKSASVALGTTQLLHEVLIAEDMKASVYALFLSTDMSFAIQTKNVIVGTQRSKKTKVCEGNRNDGAKARACYPYGRFDLKKGDKIDFTWGITSHQEGMLAYTIWPSG